MTDAKRPVAPGVGATDATVESYKAGIDRTLLRENLRLTPDERVQNLMALQRLAEAARAGGRRATA